ncbi:hypothetical protein GCM10010489_27120 [Microbacterium saperdae]|nr:hypothetical protein GCM10010489_27120 [Microbacterium saperdae]
MTHGYGSITGRGPDGERARGSHNRAFIVRPDGGPVEPSMKESARDQFGLMIDHRVDEAAAECSTSLVPGRPATSAIGLSTALTRENGSITTPTTTRLSPHFLSDL